MSSSTPPANWSSILGRMTAHFGRLTDHVLDGLRQLLDSGRQMVNCAESALLVPTAAGNELRFLVSVNSRPGVAEIVTGISVPCDRSLAGYVFNSGQLIAIANPEDFYQEVDNKTGLKTSIYMVTPVMAEDEILGVATFVNRPEGQPQEPFDQNEIESAQRLADLTAAGLRYFERVCLQHRLFLSELNRTTQGLDVSRTLTDDLLNAAGEQSPLARALSQLEKMSQSNQDLAADLIDVLSAHEDSFDIQQH